MENALIRFLWACGLASTLLAQAPAVQVPTGLKPGDPCPVFLLPGTDGKPQGPEAALPRLVVFLSTECPYVLATQGRMEDSWRDAANVAVRDLEAATEALLAGRPIAAEQTPSRGCFTKSK